MTNTDRDALLDAALVHVPFEGMNERALAAGARDIGMDAALIRVHFPQGGAGLAAAYHRRADRALREAFLSLTPAGRAIYEELAPIALEVVARLGKDVAPADRETFERVLTLLIDRAAALANERRTPPSLG